MTRSTAGRLLRRAVAIGDLDAADSPVAKAAWLRGFVRGRARRLAGSLASCHYCHATRLTGAHNGRGGHLFLSRATMIGGVA